MSEHELLQKIFLLMRGILLCRNGENNSPRPIKNTSKQECYDVLAEIQDLLGTNRFFLFPLKQTNADRIRGMTDEELAAWLFHHLIVCVPGKRPNPEDCVGGCERCWLDWLKA